MMATAPAHAATIPATSAPSPPPTYSSPTIVTTLPSSSSSSSSSSPYTRASLPNTPSFKPRALSADARSVPLAHPCLEHFFTQHLGLQHGLHLSQQDPHQQWHPPMYALRRRYTHLEPSTSTAARHQQPLDPLAQAGGRVEAGGLAARNANHAASSSPRTSRVRRLSRSSERFEAPKVARSQPAAACGVATPDSTGGAADPAVAPACMRGVGNLASVKGKERAVGQGVGPVAAGTNASASSRSHAPRAASLEETEVDYVSPTWIGPRRSSAPSATLGAGQGGRRDEFPALAPTVGLPPLGARAGATSAAPTSALFTTCAAEARQAAASLSTRVAPPPPPPRPSWVGFSFANQARSCEPPAMSPTHSVSPRVEMPAPPHHLSGGARPECGRHAAGTSLPRARAAESHHAFHPALGNSSSSSSSDSRQVQQQHNERRIRLVRALESWELGALGLARDELEAAACLVLEAALSLPAPPRRGPTGGGVVDVTLAQYTGMGPDEVRRLVTGVSRLYHDANGYHNFTHAVDVLQAAYLLLHTLGAVPSLDEALLAQTSGGAANLRGGNHAKPVAAPTPLLPSLDVLALLLAALGHDGGHPGLTNAFLRNAQSTLSRAYAPVDDDGGAAPRAGRCCDARGRRRCDDWRDSLGGASALENFHAQLFEAVLRRCGFAHLVYRSDEDGGEDKVVAGERCAHSAAGARGDSVDGGAELSEFGQTIRQCILATDMALHTGFVAQLRALSNARRQDGAAAVTKPSAGAVGGGDGSSGGDEGNAGMTSFVDAPHSERVLVCAALLKCADTSNPCRSAGVGRQWSLALRQEWATQRALERECGLPDTMATVCCKATAAAMTSDAASTEGGAAGTAKAAAAKTSMMESDGAARPPDCMPPPPSGERPGAAAMQRRISAAQVVAAHGGAGGLGALGAATQHLAAPRNGVRTLAPPPPALPTTGRGEASDTSTPTLEPTGARAAATEVEPPSSSLEAEFPLAEMAHVAGALEEESALASGQLTFVRLFVRPLFEAACALLPGLWRYCDRIASNDEEWSSRFDRLGRTLDKRDASASLPTSAVQIDAAHAAAAADAAARAAAARIAPAHTSADVGPNGDATIADASTAAAAAAGEGVLEKERSRIHPIFLPTASASMPAEHALRAVSDAVEHMVDAAMAGFT